MKLNPPFESCRVRTQPRSKTFFPMASGLRASATVIGSIGNSVYPQISQIALIQIQICVISGICGLFFLLLDLRPSVAQGHGAVEDQFARRGVLVSAEVTEP